MRKMFLFFHVIYSTDIGEGSLKIGSLEKVREPPHHRGYNKEYE